MKNFFFDKKYYVYEDKVILCAQDKVDPNNGIAFDEEEIMQAFADTLREIRTEANLSITETAKAIGIPQQTLSSYELKTRIPSLLQAIRICAFFECSIEDFISYGLGIGAYEIVEKFRQKIEFKRDIKK